jgi:hypothetical protein
MPRPSTLHATDAAAIADDRILNYHSIRRLLMFTMWAVLVYLLAMAIPICLLYRFHSQAWYWHVLAVIAALALGFMPTPAGLKTAGFDLLLGFAFIVLMIWGAGGLILFRPRHEKHA